MYVYIGEKYKNYLENTPIQFNYRENIGSQIQRSVLGDSLYRMDFGALLHLFCYLVSGFIFFNCASFTYTSLRDH